MAAVTYDLNTTEATTMKDFLGGDGGLPGDVVVTFDVAASTSIKKGEPVTLSSGYATNMTATTDVPAGVCIVGANNIYKADGTTAGAAGDKQISVVVRGMVKMNAFCADSGDYDDALVPFTRCGIADDDVNTAGSCVACGADPTIYIGTMLSTLAAGVGTTDALVLALVYVDLLGPSRAL